MFSIFKRKYPKDLDLSGLHIDMHSHLLPGIDDGSPDESTSIELINGLESLGYKKFITTPHIMWDLYKNTSVTINRALQQLKAYLQSKGKIVDIEAGAEYYMDDHFADLLHDKAPLRTLKDKIVLVEFSFVNAPMNLKERLFELQIGGYRPVLAHPERYTYLASNRKVFDELKSAGCLFQVNILSFTGHYGRSAQEMAEYLVKNNYVELIGTDLHHHHHLELLRKSPQLIVPIQRLLDAGKLMNPTL